MPVTCRYIAYLPRHVAHCLFKPSQTPGFFTSGDAAATGKGAGVLTSSGGAEAGGEAHA